MLRLKLMAGAAAIGLALGMAAATPALADAFYGQRPAGTTVVTYEYTTYGSAAQQRCLDEVAMLADEALPISGSVEVDAEVEDAARLCRAGEVALAQKQIHEGYEALYDSGMADEPAGQ